MHSYFCRIFVEFFVPSNSALKPFWGSSTYHTLWEMILLFSAKSLRIFIFLQNLLGMMGQYDVYLFLINRSILSTKNKFSNENDSFFAETKIHAKWLKEGFCFSFVVVGSMWMKSQLFKTAQKTGWVIIWKCFLFQKIWKTVGFCFLILKDNRA